MPSIKKQTKGKKIFFRRKITTTSKKAEIKIEDRIEDLKMIIKNNMKKSIDYKKHEIYSISEYNTMNQELESTYSKLLDLSMLINASDIDVNKIDDT